MQQTIRKMTAAVLGLLIAMTLVSIESRAAQLTAEPASETEISESAQYEETEADADPVTEQLIEEYRQILDMYFSEKGNSYEEELAYFPESYRGKLQQLHAAHPSWEFVAVNTGIDWEEAVAMESRSYRSGTLCYSLLPKYASKLFLSRKSTDYDINTGSYINKDGSTWVSASEGAVAYYLDPRNFLTENSIFQFEAFDYKKEFHTLSGVEAVLKETDLSHRRISYYTTGGKKIDTAITYGEAIFAAGIKYGISPITLAVKIRQETGASLQHGSISGQYSYNGVSYRGYYNYYNVGANAVSMEQGSAIANGLVFAMGGADGSGTTYARPWISPLLAIDGGAEHLAERFLKGGRNTIYFKKFNVVEEPYYEKQYMQNLHGAVGEANMASQSYERSGLTDSAFVFFIPVYENMPDSGSDITIQKTVHTGKTVSNLNLRSGPSVDEPILVEIPEREVVTVGPGVFNNHPENVEKQLYDPYWVQVQYGDLQGYSSIEFLKMSVEFCLKKGQTRQLQVICNDHRVYFETGDPAVATVDSEGIVTGVGRGICMIYAVNGSGTRVDSISVCVEGLQTPVLREVKNVDTGVKITWQSVNEADGYCIYRKSAGSSWEQIARLPGSFTEVYIDKTAVSGVSCTYSVDSYSGNAVSEYDTSGLKILYLASPVLNTPSNVKAGVAVSWKPLAGAAGYYVYRKSGSGSWKKIAEVSGADTVKYVDPTAVDGVSYDYTVKGYNGSTTGVYNGKGKTILRMNNPVLLQPVNAEKGIQVKWEQAVGATGYRVYRKSDSGSWERIADVDGGAVVSYIDQQPQHGITYTYTVRAVSGTVTSSYDTTGKKLKRIQKPSLTAPMNSPVGVSVNWKKLTGVDGYYIYRKDEKGNWKKIGTVAGAEKETYVDQTAAAGVTYTYTVRGYSGSTEGARSSAGKSICYLLNPAVLEPVNKEKGMQVKWESTPGATGYRVYRKANGENWEQIAELQGESTISNTDQTVQHGTTYTYTVCAVNGNSVSSYDAAGKSQLRLDTPEILTPVNRSDGIQVNWKSLHGVDGYYVYRKSGSVDWKRIGVVTGADSVMYMDQTAATGVVYDYTVKAYSGNTAGGYSAKGKSIQRL